MAEILPTERKAAINQLTKTGQFFSDDVGIRMKKTIEAAHIRFRPKISRTQDESLVRGAGHPNGTSQKATSDDRYPF